MIADILQFQKEESGMHVQFMFDKSSVGKESEGEQSFKNHIITLKYYFTRYSVTLSLPRIFIN